MSYLTLIVLGYAGVLGSDVIAYFMGRRVGLHPRGRVAWLIGQDDIARIQRFYNRYGVWTIVISRQLPGTRLPAFFFAGASGIPIGRFLRYDCAAALVTVGVYPWLGYTFADDLTGILLTLARFRNVVFGFVAVGVVFGLSRVVRNRRRVAARKQRERDES